MGFIDDLVKLEQEYYPVAVEALGPAASLDQDIVELYDQLLKIVQTKPRDADFLPTVLTHICRYELVMASLAIKRCHFVDSMAPLRRAIEACAFAHRVHRNPDLVSTYHKAVLNRAAYENYRNKFQGNLWPKGHALLQSLHNHHSYASTFVHNSILSVGMRIKWDVKYTTFESIYFDCVAQDKLLFFSAYAVIIYSHLLIIRVLSEVFGVPIDDNIRIGVAERKFRSYAASWLPVTIAEGQV